jgi:hypothetical protein
LKRNSGCLSELFCYNGKRKRKENWFKDIPIFVDISLHAPAKTLTFVVMDILVILCFWRPTGQPMEPFGASRYVFACSCKNHNFYWKRCFSNLTLSMPYRTTSGTFWGFNKCFYMSVQKNIFFAKMSILVILRFQCHTDQPIAPFRASSYVFACPCDSHNFHQSGYFVNFAFSTSPISQSRACFRASLGVFACSGENFIFC